ncbi:MAG: sulfite exporter TauE/SafE family protein [Candidatus Omnitrophica bacterium]|nr:sulfite exporter TauE/SafE family protein [Candidatus Omnitrophota bacterium]
MASLLTSFFVAGVLFASGPCMGSCGPLLAASIAGTGRSVGQAFVFYALFSLARIASYVVLGLAVFSLGAAAAGELFGFDLSLPGGVFVALVGVFMIMGTHIRIPGFGFLRSLLVESRLSNPLFFGLLYGLIPCVPFVALVSYIGLVAKTWQQAAAFTFVFGMGTFASPLLLISLFSGFIPGFLKNRRDLFAGIIRIGSGCLLLVLAFGLMMR